MNRLVRSVKFRGECECGKKSPRRTALFVWYWMEKHEREHEAKGQESEGGNG